MKNRINWYPGHMFKTKKDIIENLKNIDVFVEVLDSRIPQSSRNPDILEIFLNKKSIKRIIVLNKSDLADDGETKKWIEYFKSNENVDVLSLDSNSKKDVEKLRNLIKAFKKGVTTAKTLISGIPNVGKSTIINRLANKNIMIAKNTPGVTKKLAWIRIDKDISLLDSPGILMPRFEENTGVVLGINQAIKEENLDTLTLTIELIKKILENPKYSEMLKNRYNLTCKDLENTNNINNNPIFYYNVLEKIALKKNVMKSGNVCDIEKTAKMILNDYRSGRIGKISLERVEDTNEYGKR